MKLQIMSDLHLKMHADRGSEFVRHLDPTGVDVLVLAGDITMARHYEDLENVFTLLARKYRHILYVPGNHEYYRSSPKQSGDVNAVVGRKVSIGRDEIKATLGIVETLGKRLFAGILSLPH